MLICSRDCFDSKRAIYYRQGTSYERDQISDPALLQYFLDADEYRKEKSKELERELKSVSSVTDARADAVREIRTRKKLQEVDE